MRGDTNRMSNHAGARVAFKTSMLLRMKWLPGPDWIWNAKSPESGLFSFELDRGGVFRATNVQHNVQHGWLLVAAYLTKRDGFWHYARRVPLPLVELDKRGVVKESTKVRVADDPRAVRAGRVADRINGEVEAYWRGLADGKAAEAKNRYDAARKRARAFGFDYAQVDELAGRGTAEILARFEALVGRKAVDSEGDAAAVLGGEAPPEFRISTMFDEFEKLSRASISDFSEDQLRKWRNPRKRAIANLTTVIGDKAMPAVTRSDALDFRIWWQDRVIDEGLMIETANRDIGHLANMFRNINQAHRLGMEPVFAELRIAGGHDGQRSAFEPVFIQSQLLADAALESLNDEARAIVYLIVETGLRLSEACNLTEETINLDAKVPYVSVRPDGRRMKTPQSQRDLPLVGVSLMAMRQFPKGFARYRHKADALSAIVNKQLGVLKLRPTANHSIYSLRHSFEDRLTAVEAPEKLIAALMGHKYSRPKYGTGPSLEQKQKWLRRIAFKPPSMPMAA